MNKGRRNELARLKRKKRLHNWVNGLDIFITKDGKRIHKPKITDIPDNCWTVLKSTGTPCSCAICSPRKSEGDKAKYRLSKAIDYV